MQIIEGTWEEVVLHAEELKGKKLRVTVMPDDMVDTAQPKSGETMADYFREFIGVVSSDGNGSVLDTGDDFADHLAEKKRKGHL